MDLGEVVLESTQTFFVSCVTGEASGHTARAWPCFFPGSLLEQEKVQPATAIAGDDLLPPGASTTRRARIAVECGQREAGLQVLHLQRVVV